MNTSWTQRGCLLLVGVAALVLSGGPLRAQTADCSNNPSSPQCQGADQQQDVTVQNGTMSNTRGQQGQGGSNTQPYIDSAGNRTNQPQDTNDTRQRNQFPTEPPTDFQRLARASMGETLPIFGRDLFRQAPTTFAPADQIPSLADYLVGPGDELLVRLWGPVSFNGQLTVDSSGSIYVPQVGAIHVAGLKVSELQAQISSDLRHTFRNFNLSVNLGHLRSIQVYVVGEASRPGAYTISALSTVLNVLFVSGGPNAQGSLRRIQVRRSGAVVGELDLYDLLLRGDKSKDIRLEPGDTIFIPAAGPQVALAGSVRHPAIYELRDDSSIGDLLKLAGGFTPTGSPLSISLERIEDSRQRAATTVALDAAGLATKLKDGDVLFANHIASSFDQTVTIRGNLMNPGRFQWHPGMHLSDIIPDRMSLLTNDYWQSRNRLGVPAPLFTPLPANPLARTANRTDITPSQQPADFDRTATQTQDATQNQYSSQNQNSQSRIYDPATGENTRARAVGTNGEEQVIATSIQGTAGQTAPTTNDKPSTLLTLPAPEIDWSYAVIERLDPNTLKNSLVPFNLGRLVQDHDAAQNLELQAGDVVTILSQEDIHVSQDERTKYVRLEGEFKGAGVYSVGPDETLADVARRAGGLTTKAYLYGSTFTRESARVFQQQRLDEYISRLSISMQRDAAERTVSSTSSIPDPNSALQQREIISQLHQLRATGRIVLQFLPGSAGVESVPDLPLENGDVFRIPSRPATVAVIGAVYGQNTFLYNSKRRVRDYVSLAGKPTTSGDPRHSFLIRADGSIYIKAGAQGAWGNAFDSAVVNPGDTIVIPEKPIRPSAIRQIIDYSQIFSQFALGAAAISVIKQ